MGYGITPPGVTDLQDKLNRCMPVAEDTYLGDLLYDLINTVNALAAQNAALAATQAVAVTATVVQTLGGSVQAGDTIGVTFTNAGMSASPIVVAPVGVVTSIAHTGDLLVAAAAANAACVAAGIYGVNVTGTVTWHQKGTLGNSTVVTAQITHTAGSADITSSIASSGDMSGGVDNIGTAPAAVLLPEQRTAAGQ
jgi:hypothetical protein